MQKHSKIRNMPFPRPCGATGNDAQKLHAPAFAHFRGAVLTHEVLCQQVLRAAEAGVDAVFFEKLLVRAAFGDAAVGNDDDLACGADGGQAVCDDERGAVLCQLVKRVLDLRLGQRVKGARRLVKDEDGRIFEENARDGNALLLSCLLYTSPSPRDS